MYKSNDNNNSDKNSHEKFLLLELYKLHPLNWSKVSLQQHRTYSPCTGSVLFGVVGAKMPSPTPGGSRPRSIDSSHVHARWRGRRYEEWRGSAIKREEEGRAVTYEFFNPGSRSKLKLNRASDGSLSLPTATLFDSRDAVPKIFRSRRALTPRTWAETAKQCNAVGERGERVGETLGDGLYAIVPFRFGKARETCHSRPRIRSSNAFALNDHVRSKSFLSLKRFLEKRVRGVKFRLNSDLKIE